MKFTTLICHGDADPLVPHHQSELLTDALKHAGVPVTFYTVRGAGHGQFSAGIALIGNEASTDSRR